MTQPRLDASLSADDVGVRGAASVAARRLLRWEVLYPDQHREFAPTRRLDAHDSVVGKPVAGVALCPGLTAMLTVGLIGGDETGTGGCRRRQVHLDSQSGVVKDLSEPTSGLTGQKARRRHGVQPSLTSDGMELEGGLGLGLSADQGEALSGFVGDLARMPISFTW